MLALAALVCFFSATSIATRSLSPRADHPSTNLYVCTDKNWGGKCKNLELAVSACHDMEDAFNKDVSSAGPDDGTFCVLYSEKRCAGKAIPFTNPGIGDFTKYKFDDELSSVRCDFIWGWPRKSE
ncbi:hypothetical protein E8E13_001413 [Curvularia kusanoi]|uniref:Uncharacterized protein n=1 Tax=Curvularia kusanoi TaxID=90978 RepID=A0A9P4T8C3_CURKU|nr:hypothetical protein E8E13_001413 [Curvularia kusanoi]